MGYKKVGLPWSNGLGKDVKDCVTSKEVLEKAKLDWQVEKCELMAKMPFTLKGNNSLNETAGDFSHKGNIYRPCPNGYATFRTDINVPLGVVKDKYEVIQNTDAFAFFDDAIGEGKALWQSAGHFGVGEKIFITAKLPYETTVKGDKIDNYLVFSNSHDGSSSINILFTPIRVICTNMLNAALDSNSSYIRIRHTKSAKEKLSTGAEVLRIACEHAKTSQELYESLTKINMSDTDVAKYICKMILTAEEYANAYVNYGNNAFENLAAGNFITANRLEISTRKLNKISSMFAYYQEGIGQRNILGTAWGAYNAVTGYYSNVANMNGEKRMDSLLYGGANVAMLKGLQEAVKAA